jgi:hypothetical protein
MIARTWAHVRSLWSGWGILLPLPFVLWPLYCFARGERRGELVLLLVLVPALAYGNAATKKLFVGIFPLGLVALFYDSMRFIKNLGLAPVHDCDLRSMELSLFGITSGGVRMTLHDWFQQHSVPALDFLCAIPYGTFIYVSVAFAIFLYIKDYPALRRYAWTFFIINVAGFTTYHIYPAAPPWYFHAHGCTVDMATHASEGPNLARVDAALGFRYFAGFYGRSNDVFGAMPSLHVAYPLLIVLEGWKNFRAPLRAASVMFSATMIFAAVYLDHHWVLDVIAGLSYCLVAHLLMRFVFARLGARARARALEGGSREDTPRTALARN